MRVHYIQNDPLATLGFIEEWVVEKGFSLSSTKMYENESLPPLEEVDFLIILGGRMGAYEEEHYPWLVNEKNYLREVVRQDKMVLGICLGCQLLANVLGGNVFPHSHQEIGWCSLELNDNGKTSPFFKGLPSSFTAFEFHGDTFDVPEDACLLAKSEGCSNQAFSYGNTIVGIQFHPEFTGDMLSFFKKKFGQGLDTEEFVQDPNLWVNQDEFLGNARMLIFTVLNNMVEVFQEKYTRLEKCEG